MGGYALRIAVVHDICQLVAGGFYKEAREEITTHSIEEKEIRLYARGKFVVSKTQLDRFFL